MQYIIFDMEWNQPFSKESAIHSPIYLSGEIIQIGAVKLNERGKAVDCIDLLIAPTFYKRLHYRIKKITGIDQQMLKGKPNFKDAIAEFRDWCGEDCILLSWGYDDIEILKDNLLMHDMDESWLPSCFNLQGIYNHQVAHENRQFSLEHAMEKMELTTTLKAHNAFNDAIDTARVARELNLKKGIRHYKELDGVLWNSMHSTKEVFSPFRTKEAAFADPRLALVECPICHKTLKVKKFYPLDEKHAYGEIKTKHGQLSVKLKLQETRHRKYFIKRTVRFL